MKKEYSTIQIEKDIKKKFTEYCEENGYKISGLLKKLIVAELKTTNSNE